MAFTWTPISQGTIIRANHIQELHNNINTVRNKVNLSNFSWTKTPNVGDFIDRENDILEMRQALDEAENENYCHTHYSNHNSNVENGHNASVLSSNNAGDNATHKNSVLDSDNNSYNGDDNTTDNSNYDSSVYSDHDVYNYSTHDTTNLESHNSDVKSTHNNTYLYQENNAHKYTYDTSVLNDNHSNYNGGDDKAQNNTN